MRKPKRLPCGEAGRKCEFSVAHETVHNGLDGRVFEVRRLECSECSERVVVAKEQARRGELLRRGVIPPEGPLALGFGIPSPTGAASFRPLRRFRWGARAVLTGWLWSQPRSVINGAGFGGFEGL